MGNRLSKIMADCGWWGLRQSHQQPGADTEADSPSPPPGRIMGFLTRMHRAGPALGEQRPTPRPAPTPACIDHASQVTLEGAVGEGNKQEGSPHQQGN